ATDNINYTTVISLPKGVTFYIDTNCEVNTKYYYKLIVKDKSGLTSPAVDVDVFTMYKILLLPGEKVVLKYKYLDEQLILLFSQLSLNQTVEVEIKTKDNFINMSNEMNITPVTSVYEIKTKPNKVKFNVPVKIQLYYNQQKLQNINEERLRLFLYDETLTKWLMLNNSKVVLNENYVEAEVYNFSCFVAGVYKYEYEKFFKEEHVYATPSPARGDEVKFKFIVYQPVKVKVYVYDISGDFVWQSEEKEFTQQDVGKLHEIKWNIKNVATGLYVFRIEGKQFGKKQNVIKKVAIIH
ncbi:MAG: T9SS type A sorting domain-containing protein, partial [Endomicrobia bacterium]|nr:T9SS type A sorting domain-containing protein [Endomicrobiia bacterium]